VFATANVVCHPHVSAEFGVDLTFVAYSKSMDVIVLAQMLDLEKPGAVDTFL
jgi:hypothetical protein